MTQDLYHYTFGAEVPIEDVEAALLLALWGTESLFGESQTFLDAGHVLDAAKRQCVIDAATEVGARLNRLFTGFLRREFGPAAFRVERIEASRRVEGMPSQAI